MHEGMHKGRNIIIRYMVRDNSSSYIAKTLDKKYSLQTFGGVTFPWVHEHHNQPPKTHLVGVLPIMDTLYS